MHLILPDAAGKGMGKSLQKSPDFPGRSPIGVSREGKRRGIHGRVNVRMSYYFSTSRVYGNNLH